ncbi:proline iminopeptidase [Phialemonium atrogriseum]|uniref:Proline iminopeptidase n=1 Tax=Phialemonium atrogriseum TaxID=1093897 RepID=A0AAJ0BRD6_9PEZI|nr:proline iminopeptidase [Phialemonium atrogriseum]KAK1762886.1 proline iminopeptidase [Phialemonium atrogriseum]
MHNPKDGNIQEATLLSRKLVPNGELITSQMSFRVPLDYRQPEGDYINLGATMVHAFATPGESQDNGKYLDNKSPIFVFLCGGPGTANDPFRIPALNRALLTGTFLQNTKFQVLYLDYRGTGRSDPITASTLARLGDVREQAEYLMQFRQDNTVRDLEAARKCLSAKLWNDHNRPWSIMGQSYGGWIALTYLSLCPGGLKEVFLTGGLAPVGHTPDEVYAETYRQVRAQNRAFFARDARNGPRVRQVALHILTTGNNRIRLPSGGTLTVQRLMLLGRALGGATGLDDVERLVATMAAEAASAGALSRRTLERFDAAVRLAGRPLYAALHEAIYCDGPGVASRWAAQRMGRGVFQSSPEYWWLRGGPVTAAQVGNEKNMFFAGEMIYPFHFDTFAELVAFKDVAGAVAARTDWPALYDQARLAANTVPVCAVGYSKDMYVSARLGQQTASKVRGLRYFESPDLAHDAIRTNTDLVLGYLVRMSQGLPARG